MKYLLEFRDHSLNEGGNAFADTVSIPREKVEPIFTKFKGSVASIFGGQTEPELIGSWRQKAISGDLDALFYSSLGLDEISARFAEAGYETQIFHGFNIVSVRFEFEPGKAAQIDLFVRPADSDREMTDLFYKSTDEEQYSTKHRVFLMFAALDSMKFDVESDGFGKPIKFKGYMLRPDGLYEFTKRLKKVNYAISDRKKITADASKLSEVLFGKTVPYTEWNTFKKLLAQLKLNQALNMKEILVSYRQRLMDEGLAVPAEVN
jgi:hypothetical protein